jgi:hypothetical protein
MRSQKGTKPPQENSIMTGATRESLVAFIVVACLVAPGQTLANPTLYTNPADFGTAISTMGFPAFIDSGDINAGAFNSSLYGRVPFDDSYYAGRGVTFSNRAGLFWNPSSSLSVGRFTFDPYYLAAGNDTRNLIVSLDPGRLVAAFSFVDNGTKESDESVRFVDPDSNVITQIGSAPISNAYRAFIRIVSLDSPIEAINIAETAGDVNYDDFIAITSGAKP